LTSPESSAKGPSIQRREIAPGQPRRGDHGRQEAKDIVAGKSSESRLVFAWRTSVLTTAHYAAAAGEKATSRRDEAPDRLDPGLDLIRERSSPLKTLKAPSI